MYLNLFYILETIILIVHNDLLIFLFQDTNKIHN
jgi:hypothetical protein